MSSYIKVEINNKLAVITLNRPKSKNAINTEMYEELTNVLEKLSENNEVTVTALTGTGEYYSSGTDLKESIISGSEPIDKVIKVTSQRVRKFVEAFINHKKILVAVVNGPAIGIAVTTLGLCDIVYCSDTATFQTPFTRLAMSAEGCSSYTFPRIMGFSKANQMLLFNHKFTAQEAYNIGLVAKVYTKDQIDSILWPELRKNASDLPIQSLTYTKAMIRKFDLGKLHEANRIECERLEERWQSDEFMNAMMSFINRAKL